MKRILFKSIAAFFIMACIGVNASFAQFQRGKKAEVAPSKNQYDLIKDGDTLYINISPTERFVIIVPAGKGLNSLQEYDFNQLFKTLAQQEAIEADAFKNALMRGSALKLQKQQKQGGVDTTANGAEIKRRVITDVNSGVVTVEELIIKNTDTVSYSKTSSLRTPESFLVDKEETNEKGHTYTSISSSFEAPFFRSTFYKPGSKTARKAHATSSVNVSIGLNNYMTPNGEFIGSKNEPYTLDPGNSRYFSIGGFRNYVVPLKGKTDMVFSGGLEIAWYNFMYADNNVLTRPTDRNQWVPSSLSGYANIRKSKHTVAFVNVPLMLRFENLVGNFNLGIGGYAGVRVASYTSVKFLDDDGERETERMHRPFGTNTIQYGARLELGFKEVNLFCNYNFSNLYVDAASPALTPISFGVSF